LDTVQVRPAKSPKPSGKAIESAKKNLVRVNLTQTSIPHVSLGRYGAGQVLIKPAPEGTGVIAGARGPRGQCNRSACMTLCGLEPKPSGW